MAKEKLHIVTVATESKYYFPYLQQSCERHGVPLEVLGMGEKWEGFNWKYFKMVEYLKSIPENDIVCFVDGYDVICCRDLKELPAEFKRIQKETGCKIVVAGSNIDYSFATLAARAYYGTCANKFINTGTYIGYSKDILNIIESILKLNSSNIADDQQLLTEYCNVNSNDIYIDDHKSMFCTIFAPFTNITKFVDIKNGQEVHYNSNRPFLIHACGFGFLDNLIHNLGYDIELGVISNQILYDSFDRIYRSHILRLLKEYWLRFLLAFLLLVVVVFVVRAHSFKRTAENVVRKIRRATR
jgi:hypothetical protein